MVVDEVLEIPIIPVKFIFIVSDSIFVDGVKTVVVPVRHCILPLPQPCTLS